MMRGILGTILLSLSACASRPPKPDPAKNYSEPLPGTKVSFDMVHIPGDGKSIKPFWIGKTEVTWDEYQIFCDEYTETVDPLTTPPETFDAIARPSPPGSGAPERGLGLGRQPAMGITWSAARRYCLWLSRKTGHAYRLPTEAEWAFACGPTPASIDEVAWHAGNSDGFTHDVATKKPNDFGLYDMLGNVLEYVSDLEAAKGPVLVGGSFPDKKVPILRGGSYKDAPADIRSDRRQQMLPKWVERDPQRPRSQWWAFDGPVGFRLARSGE